jgi:hypothetical protein
MKKKPKKMVPFMTQLGIPLTKNSISMLLKEINTLNRINEGTNLLQYTNWLGKPITMVSISKFDFVMGGDHGQRKFRMVIKIIARSIDDDIVDHWVI